MKDNFQFEGSLSQPQDLDKNRQTGTTNDGYGSTFYNNQSKLSKSSPGPLSKLKKIIYFSHFILIALVTTFILFRYPHVRQFSFTLCALLLYGYMAIWTILVNFIFLSLGKQNWAVMFDRLFIKFFMMLWPVSAIISYTQESFMNINEVAYFSLYMCAISLILVIYELYVCMFAEHQNPEFIFKPNDLKQSDQKVWNQRKLYNQAILKKGKLNIDA